MAADCADLLWLGDAREVLKRWPSETTRRFGASFRLLQLGLPPALSSRSMNSIAPGLFELKAQDVSNWYRVIYAARLEGKVYVLHSFTKDTARTESKDLNVARRRWSQLQRELLKEKKDAKRKVNR